MTIRMKVMLELFAVLVPVASSTSFAQTQASSAIAIAPLAASASTAVPALIPYSGVAVDRDGHALSSETGITFLFYKDQNGGEPLFTETQSVVPDATGHYAVRIGASVSSGIPLSLFGTGETRWLEVQLAGEATPPRTLLTSVPYALKSADAATLGGLPASAFVLAASPTSSQPSGTQAVLPAVTSTAVTTTGGQTSTVAVFNGASSIVTPQSGILFTNLTSGGLGIGRGPAAALDVLGNTIFRGGAIFSRSGEATTSAGKPSFQFQFQSSVWNSNNGGTLIPNFTLQSEPTGNNTATTGATLNFLYYSGVGAAPGETGLYINPTGVIHFAPAQTFPITQGPAGPAGPQGVAGPSGPTGPTGAAGLNTVQLFTSTSLLQTFATNTDQFGPVSGVAPAIAATDYYGQFRNSLIFQTACTASNFKVNLGFESLTNPFVLTSTLRVGGTNTPLTCDSGFASGYGFTCASSGTFAIPAGSQVVVDFSHTGTNPANVFPQVTFECQ